MSIQKIKKFPVDTCSLMRYALHTVINNNHPSPTAAPGHRPGAAPSALDAAMDNAVKAVAGVRKQITEQPLESGILMSEEAGYPKLVECEVHGTMLTAVSAIATREDNTPVFYCKKCWDENEYRELLAKVRKVCKRLKVLGEHKANGPLMQPNLKADISQVGRK